ncbi:hypothetical protein ACIBJC_27255 [Streptomyces sp. NPDC050509]|uniref:hypothetical protein n=1 Tax=Streptomyces sp. NPDC050509 TaxID=3365620 RepID=UPI0037B6D566
MTNDLLSRLAKLDAAPRTEPSAGELNREETLLRSVLSDTERPTRSVGTAFRRPLVRRTVFTLAGGLAAGVAFVAVTGGLPGFGGGPLPSSELASWTAAPNALDTSADKGSAAERKCLEVTGEDKPGKPSPTIVNADVRGKIASMIVMWGKDDASYCLAASDGTYISMAISSTAKAGAGVLTLDTLGARGSDAGEFNYALGAVGADVEDVTVRDSGKTVHATVQDGRWTAWWPDGNPDGLITGTVTLTLTDGTTRTVTGEELMDQWPEE